MENNQELTHWGIKGMKWGRRRYQNKDGSLTPEGKKRYGDDDPNESTEQKRERLLKSTNAQELYKNRNLLTTNELNDRLNRINTEQRLADLAAKDQKSGFDRVDKMLKVGRKINEVYEFTNTPVMKALKKQLGIDKAEDNIKKSLGVDEVLKKWDQLSDDQVANALKRANNKKALEKMQKEAREAKDKIKEEAEKEKTNTKQNVPPKKDEPKNEKKDDPDVERWEFTGDDVIDAASKTTSSGRKAADDILDADDYGWREVNETYDAGRNYVAGLLEDSTKYLR